MSYFASAIVVLTCCLPPARGDEEAFEVLIRRCEERIREEQQNFKDEMAGYTRIFTNNAPGSVAVRSALKLIVERGEVSVGFLLGLLQSDVANKSANARDALRVLRNQGRLGSQSDRVLETILEVVSRQGAGNTLVRRNAADLLRLFNGPRLVSDIMKLIPSEVDQQVLVTMVRALGAAKAAPAVDLILELTRDDRFEVRAEAIRALGRIGTGDLSAAILARLQDESYQVRRACYQALGQLRDDRALDMLHRRLGDLASKITTEIPTDDPVRDEAIWAVEALGEIRHPSSIRVLQPLIFGQDFGFSQLVKDGIRKILARIGREGASPGVVQAVLPLLELENTSLVSAALNALISLQDRSALPHLVRLLESPSAALAGNAAEAIGEIAAPEDRKSVNALRDKFREVDGRRRGRNARLLEQIAYALGKLGRTQHLDLLTGPYDTRLKKDPRDADALVALGKIYQDVHLYRKALSRYRDALSLMADPNSRAQILYRIGICHALKGDFEDADAKLAEAAKLGVDFSEELFKKGELRRLRSSKDENLREWLERHTTPTSAPSPGRAPDRRQG